MVSNITVVCMSSRDIFHRKSSLEVEHSKYWHLKLHSAGESLFTSIMLSDYGWKILIILLKYLKETPPWLPHIIHGLHECYQVVEWWVLRIPWRHVYPNQHLHFYGNSIHLHYLLKIKYQHEYIHRDLYDGDKQHNDTFYVDGIITIRTRVQYSRVKYLTGQP